MAVKYLYCSGSIGFNSTITPTVAYCYSGVQGSSLAPFCAATTCGLPDYSSTSSGSGSSVSGSVNLIVPSGTYVPLKLGSADANDIVNTFTQVLICVVILWGFKKMVDIILSSFNLR